MTRWSADQLAEYMTRQQKQVDDHKPDTGPEAKLLSKCLKYCNDKGYPAWHDWSRKKNKAGWLDLIIFMEESRVVLMELKATSGRLRVEQQALHRQFMFLGHTVYVVRSYKRFLEIMKGE